MSSFAVELLRTPSKTNLALQLQSLNVESLRPLDVRHVVP
jgi:hypothetical protein